MFFLFDILNITLMLFALLCAFFAITMSMYVMKKRDSALVYITLAVLSGALALLFAVMRGSEHHALIDIVVRAFFFIAAFVPLAFLFYAYALLGRTPSFLDRPPVLAVLFLISGGCATLALFGTSLIQEVTQFSGSVVFVFGVWAPLFFCYLVLGVVWASGVVARALQEGTTKLSPFKSTLVALAVCVLFLSAFACFFFFAFLGITIPLPVGFFPLFLALAVLFYLSLRGMHVSVRTVIAELLIFSLWVLLLFRMFLAEERHEQIINGLIFMFAIALGALVIHLFHRERKRRESSEEMAGYLAEVNTKLRQLDKQKSEFVSIASHQLRSPLSAVVGYSSLLVEESFGKIPSALRMPIERIFESARIMAIEIDDFLNITRIEQGNMKYQFKACDIAGIAARLVKDFTFTAKEKGLTLQLERPEGEVLAYADEVKIRQVLVNLIDNAIRYTLKGYIKVSVGYKDPNTVLVTVADSGIGIPKIDQERLFGKFMRASNANMQSVHGTGLGLYLVREMILAHQGTIEIRSEEGEGTTSTITLPRRQTAEKA